MIDPRHFHLQALVLIVLGLGSAVLGSTVIAQDRSTGGGFEETAFEEAVEVRLVEVETWVTDRKGRPVYGLTRDDFQMVVDGEPQPIEHFESSRPVAADHRPDSSTDAAQGPSSAAPDGPRDPLYLAVYLDRHFLHVDDLEPAKRQIQDFLETSLGPEDRVLLAVAGEELQVLVPFAAGAGPVIDKLETLKGSSTGGKLAADYRAIFRDLRMEQQARATNQIAAGTNLDTTRVLRKAEPSTYLQEIEAFHREAAGEMRIAAEQMLELVATLTGLQGRKQVLYVGGPLPTLDAQTLFEAWRDAFQRALDDSDFFRTAQEDSLNVQRAVADAAARHGNFRVGADIFREVATAAAIADITVHTLGLTNLRRSRAKLASRADVEVGTLGRGVGTSPLVDTRAQLALDDGMRALAHMTGGRHTEGRRRVGQFFDQVSRDLASRYVLGFIAEPSPGTEPQVVKVELRNPQDRRRYTVRHRERFMVKTRNIELAERTQSALLMAASNSEHNDLNIELELYAPEARVEDWVLNLAVRVPMSKLTLIPDRGTHLGRLTLFAAAGRLGGTLTPVMKSELPVRIADGDLQTALGRRAEYIFTLRTPKDPGRVAVTVRDELGPTEATVSLDVDVSPGGGRLRVRQ